MRDDKIKIGDFEVDIILTVEIEQHISVYNYINDWTMLIKKEELRKLKELRLKKINEINAKYK